MCNHKVDDVKPLQNTNVITYTSHYYTLTKYHFDGEKKCLMNSFSSLSIMMSKQVHILILKKIGNANLNYRPRVVLFFELLPDQQQ